MRRVEPAEDAVPVGVIALRAQQDAFGRERAWRFFPGSFVWNQAAQLLGRNAQHFLVQADSIRHIW